MQNGLKTQAHTARTTAIEDTLWCHKVWKGYLSDQLRSMVADDTVLFLRALTYYVVAEESAIERPKKGPAVGYVVESPQDPESYAPEEEDEKKCPSFWAFPEWKAFAEAFDMMLISFDQGPMGHERRKPGYKSGGYEAAGGLKKALLAAVEMFLEGRRAARLTRDQWEAHLKNDHQPFRKECRTCLETAGRQRMHKRVTHPHAYTLSFDLGGPFEVGRDQGGNYGGKARYMVVGVYTLPITPEGDALLKPADEGERQEAEGELLPVEEAADGAGEDARGERSRQMAQWCMHRDLYRTFTDGDSWQMNGRAEAEVGTISRQTKTLLSQAGEEQEAEAQPTTSGLARVRWHGRPWRVEGAQVFHVRRDCSAIRHSNLVLEIQKCSACWGRNEMDTTGEMVVADGTGHRRDLPHRVDEGRTLRPCERCR
ncbi:Retrovirus-related Pol polyprotein from transposon TNT 1-94 [Durusdinium trenchii]|uniref:Retrovirus-related Pol polyprotein from transposon TNT 1-94 n=1 Tax=Durusdinium trenchii TaxID=1381693 RepID=A0ABP0KRN8_9DINO